MTLEVRANVYPQYRMVEDIYREYNLIKVKGYPDGEGGRYRRVKGGRWMQVLNGQTVIETFEVDDKTIVYTIIGK